MSLKKEIEKTIFILSTTKEFEKFLADTSKKYNKPPLPKGSTLDNVRTALRYAIELTTDHDYDKMPEEYENILKQPVSTAFEALLKT